MVEGSPSAELRRLSAAGLRALSRRGLEAGGLATMTSERYGCPGYLRSDLKNLECIGAAKVARLMRG